MENENILPIFCKTLYGSQGEGFPTPIWLTIDIKMLVRNHEGFIRVYNIFLIIHCIEQ